MALAGAHAAEVPNQRTANTNRAEQHVVVIGGSSGIGLGVARLLDADGATVTIGARNADTLAAARAELGPSARAEVIDVTSEASVRSFLDAVGPIDHLVYCAGANLETMPVAQIDMITAERYFDVRCFGILRVMKHAAAQIRPGGSVALTSGIAGARPTPGWAVAAGTSGTIEAFGRALAVELAPIRVNVVSPGTVRTALWSSMPEPVREAYYAHTADSNLTGTVSTPDEAAETYRFLMDQPFVTGSVLVVDGGRSLV
jgi:NAD(P)-dependent dehydrogenase (short-subunit alcohol dehydrogenase family)